MRGRSDALLAGAEIALAVENAALTTGSPDTVGTTGVFKIEPGAVNSIPCHATLEIDLRDTSVTARNAALAKIEKMVRAICARRKIKLRYEKLNVDPPAVCDAALVQTVSRVCRQLNLSNKKLISRAYHDTLFMAWICPVTMIFIPCRGGISHRPDEYSSPAQIEKGAHVLAETLAQVSQS